MQSEPEDKLYTQTEMARLVNRTPRTLRDWAKRNQIVPHRYPSGRPFYTLEHWRQITGVLEQEKSEQKIHKTT